MRLGSGVRRALADNREHAAARSHDLPVTESGAGMKDGGIARRHVPQAADARPG